MDDGIDYQKMYERLKDKVVATLDAQQAYFKSHKDVRMLRVSKAHEAELRKMVYPQPPPKVSQAQFEFLAQ